MEDVQDYTQDEEYYDKVSKMYIRDKTREGYHEKSRLLLLWLIEKRPECVSEAVKESKLWDVFNSQI